MSRLFASFSLLALLFAGPVSFAQTHSAGKTSTGFLNDSLNPEIDAEAIRTMRARMDEIRKHRPTVALVLSGGGAKGAAHVGVFKYLEEIGMPVDMITGTSMGGLMGGLYALGYDAAQIDSLLRSMDWSVMMTDAMPQSHLSYFARQSSNKYLVSVPFDYGRELWEKNDNTNKFISVPEGLINGFNVRNLITSKTVGYQDSLDFSKLPIPFFCVASDLATMKEFNWSRGHIIDALRSTMSIPFYFYPVRIGDMVLTDGGTRNNFPVDIARTMGADYIIGVDLHVETGPDEVRGLASFVSQFTDMPGIDTYFENIKDVDVHIQPELSGFNMMSFSTENIAQLLENGYKAAQDHAGELADIKRAVGSDAGRYLSGKPATDIEKTAITISGVRFEGIREDEIAYFLDKMHITPGKKYSRNEIEDEISYIYASGAFSDVTYSLHGTQEPYELTFHCKRGAANNVSVGARFDTEELAAVVLNLGLNANRLNGSKYELNLKLSNNPTAHIRYSFTPAKGYQFGALLSTGYSDVNMLNFAEDGSSKPRIREWHNTAQLFGTNTRWINGASAIGIEFENMPFLEVSGLAYTGKKRDWDRLAFSAFYSFDYDTTNDKYFPTDGIRINGRSRLMFAGTNLLGQHLSPYLIGRISATSAMSFGERFTLLPSLHASLATSDDLYLRHRNFVGGDISMRYSDFHLPFVGCNGVYTAKSNIVGGDIKARYRLGKNNYLSAATGGFFTADSLKGLFRDESAIGVALQYEHMTIVGPLKADIHWSSKTKSFGFYLSAGYEF